MVAEEIVFAAVIGEKVIHVLGVHRAGLHQRGGEEFPGVGVPAAQGQAAIGKGLLLQVPHALQGDLLADGVLGHIHQLDGGAFVFIVGPAYCYVSAAGGPDGGEGRGLGALKGTDGFALLPCAAWQDQQQAQQKREKFVSFHRDRFFLREYSADRSGRPWLFLTFA